MKVANAQTKLKFPFMIYFITTSWSWKSITKEKYVLYFLLYLLFDI